MAVGILLEVCGVFLGQRCRTHFGVTGGVTVEIIRMVINMPPLSGHGDKGLRVWLIWCGNYGSGDIAGGWWVLHVQR